MGDCEREANIRKFALANSVRKGRLREGCEQQKFVLANSVGNGRMQSACFSLKSVNFKSSL